MFDQHPTDALPLVLRMDGEGAQTQYFVTVTVVRFDMRFQIDDISDDSAFRNRNEIQFSDEIGTLPHDVQQVVFGAEFDVHRLSCFRLSGAWNDG